VAGSLTQLVFNKNKLLYVTNVATFVALGSFVIMHIPMPVSMTHLS